MKRRILYYDKRGVSNVIAYCFSFSIATMVMVSSVYITNSIIENKTAQIAGLQAQSIANKIAYGVVEAIVSRQSNPGSNYTKTLDIPLDLAGLSYYIEITDTAVYVNTSNGQVSGSCSIYNAENLNIGISTGIYSGSSKIDIHYKEPDYAYKFDFGKGNNVSHSPVESGYYMVTELDQEWHNGYDSYLYRIPINVSNPSSENLTDVPVKIVLNTGNFDYSHASVTYTSESRSEVSSDLVFRNDTYPNGIPYYIDHWNPEGESVILMNMTLENYSYEHIHLYYGGPSANHNIGEISMFFDDFDSGLGQWDTDGSSPTVGDGKVTLHNDDFIITKIFKIPLIETPTLIPGSINVSEAMYIVEAKMKINNNGQGNMILLSKSDYTTGCYLASANFTPYSKLFLLKKPVDQELHKVNLPDLNHWLRLKSYVYISDTCYPGGSHTKATLIKSYLYNFTTFAYRGNVSGLDTDPDYGDDATGAPYLEGNIGLGCGLFGSETGDVIVDWIRVMKTPINPPTVSIGPLESKKYKWSGTVNVNAGIKYNSSNPFDPGPVLCDFNYLSEDGIFEIEDFPDGSYTITVTMGNYSGTCDDTVISIDSEPVVNIPATEEGKFETKWFPLEWAGGDLDLTFSSAGTWTVNSIVIERGEKGIKITQG